MVGLISLDPTERALYCCLCFVWLPGDGNGEEFGMLLVGVHNEVKETFMVSFREGSIDEDKSNNVVA